jgi:hypothetical protein
VARLAEREDENGTPENGSPENGAPENGSSGSPTGTPDAE